MNSRFCFVKNIELLNIIKKHKFHLTSILTEGIVRMFENNFIKTLIRPLIMYILIGFKYKAAEIIGKLKGFNGGNKRNKYLQTL